MSCRIAGGEFLVFTDILALGKKGYLNKVQINCAKMAIGVRHNPISLRIIAFEFMDNSLIMMTVDNSAADQNQTGIEAVSNGSYLTLADT